MVTVEIDVGVRLRIYLSLLLAASDDGDKFH